MIFENGNYLTYPNKSGVTNYSLQNDFVGYDKSVCTEKATDGKYSRSPPFYTLGSTPQKNCIFYNYTLPYSYPYSGGSRTPNPVQYWYYPYYKDPTFYDNPLEVRKS